MTEDKPRIIDRISLKDPALTYSDFIADFADYLGRYTFWIKGAGNMILIIIGFLLFNHFLSCKTHMQFKEMRIYLLLFAIPAIIGVLLNTAGLTELLFIVYPLRV